MRFSATFIFSALAAAAAAQNPFTRTSYSGIEARMPEVITWEPTTQGTVSIVLMKGNPGNLAQVEVVAANIINDGNYTWIPSAALPESSDYALKIVDDLNPTAKPNYTPQFQIKSDTVAPSPSSTATVTASSTEVVTSTATEESSSQTSEVETSTEVVTSTSTNVSTATETSGSSGSKTSTESDEVTMTTLRTSSARTSVPAPTSTGFEGAAPTAARVGAGLVGFIGAAVLLL